MEIAVSSRSLSRATSDLVVLLVHSTESWFEVEEKSVASVVSDYRRAVKDKKVSDPLIWGAPALGRERGGRFWMFAPERIERIAAGEQIKVAASRAAAYARSLKLKRVVFLLNSADGARWAGAVAEGLRLGDYRFDKYRRSDKSKPTPLEIEIIVPARNRNQTKQTLDRARIICDAVNYARNLVNEPASVVYPEVLANEARRIAKTRGLRCTVLNEKALKKQGYNGLLTVGRASPNPPRLIVLSYRPRGASKTHLALIGKGITFDTGGVCLKPGKDMWQMKGDMSGAAAVLAAMDAVGQLRPNVRVTGIVPTAHNAIGPNAALPGDIFVAKNGKTVSVENTDAEGRLILTDGLARAGEEKATHAIDIATLTGACQRALGHALSGLFTEDEDLRRRILDAGEKVGEGFWPLPLLDEYFEMIKSPVADVNNMSSSQNGGAITAGLFLREFVPAGVRWAHLDIAGAALLEKDWRYFKAGATGCTVRTLIQLCSEDWQRDTWQDDLPF
jgi:leucyl aminopeptidase